MNTSVTSFDNALKEISHYRSFPALLPFVGADYVSKAHSKLLILGESFYLPNESTIHKDPASWYASNQGSLTITKEENENEVDWINCRGLLECPWNHGGHKMYRELNACLGELNLPSHERPVSHIAYTNAFMRPAIAEGGTFKYCCVPQDIAVSIEVLSKVIATLAPDTVIFASKYAWEAVGIKVAEQFSKTTFSFVCHPTTGGRYWNKKAYLHGREKFISLLKRWAANSERN
jgi:hypothetical protein